MVNPLVVAGKAVGKWIGGKALNGVLKPVDQMVEQNLSDISTTIGSFVIRKVRGKFQRSITFTIGLSYNDSWMEEALYGILYEYNDIRKADQVQLISTNKPGRNTDLYSILGDGTHDLKYRNWNILLCISSKQVPITANRIHIVKMYTVITYDMSPEFVKMFEKDMRKHRNSLLKINADSSTINVYKDNHEGNGYTYWEMSAPVPKRRLNTIYLPKEQMKRIVDTINEFFAKREFYQEHGIPWNLKILFYGPHGGGKSSLVKMISSEWNRNLFECSGGKNGKFIPDAITGYSEDIVAPLFSISDIDKYPILINESNVDISNKEDKQNDEQLEYKQIFNKMINALDGIGTGENRIIIMTTNHIEKFSKTFLRPGRIDLIEEIGYVVPETFRRFVLDFYNEVIPEDIELARDDISVAEMQADILFRKYDIGQFLDKYLKKNKKK